MSQVLLTILAVALTLLGERAFNGPRDIRRGDERIRNRDEDLRAWIAREAESLRSAGIGLDLDRRPRKYEYLRAYEKQKLKDQTLKRYGDQLRDAERVVREVRISEQAHHGLLRRLMRRPIPDLLAPALEAERVRGFHSTDDERYEAMREKIFKDFDGAMSQAGDEAEAQPIGAIF